MKQNLLVLIFSVAIVACSKRDASSSAPSASSAASVAPSDASVDGPMPLETLRQTTAVTVLLPASFPIADPLHLVAMKASRDHYEVVIGSSPDCLGGNACRYGTVTGDAIGSVNPPPIAPTGKTTEVQLVNGTKGHFQDATCGSTCSDSTITFDQKGNRYVFGVKAGTKEDVLKLVNAALAPR